MIGRLETEQVFSRKHREGALTAAAHEALISQFQIDCEGGLWNWLPVTKDLVAAAQETTRRLSPEAFVRSLDTSHVQAGMNSSQILRLG